MADDSSNNTDEALEQEAELPVEGQPEADRGTARSHSMRVKVHSPHKVFFDEVASSISAVNATGDFDILPRHHNFITLLDPCELIVRRTGKQPEQRIKISGGLMHVKADRVTVFLDV